MESTTRGRKRTRGPQPHHASVFALRVTVPTAKRLEALRKKVADDVGWSVDVTRESVARLALAIGLSEMERGRKKP